MLPAHAVFVDHALADAIHQHHAIAGGALAEVFVRREDAHLRHVVAPAAGRAGQRVVRLELCHRPNRDAEGGGRLFHEVELRDDVRVHALARLVAVEEIVAKGLDGVVEGHRQVRHLLFGFVEQIEQRGDHADGGLHVSPVRCDALRALGVVGAEQFEGAVDEMQSHGVGASCRQILEYCSSMLRRWKSSRSRSSSERDHATSAFIGKRRPGQVVLGPPRTCRWAPSSHSG